MLAAAAVAAASTIDEEEEEQEDGVEEAATTSSVESESVDKSAAVVAKDEDASAALTAYEGKVDDDSQHNDTINIDKQRADNHKPRTRTMATEKARRREERACVLGLNKNRVVRARAVVKL